MAAMNATDRLRARIGLIRALRIDVAALKALGLDQFAKPDLDAAIAATDDWIDTNSAAFNTALPTAFKNGATALQKTVLFCVVALRRAGLLKVSEDG